MSEEVINEEFNLADHVQKLKDNPPVEPNESELEGHQYTHAKESYDRALKLWQEELDTAEAQLLAE